MSFFQYVLILIIVIFVYDINSYITTTPSIYQRAVEEILKLELELKRDKEQLQTDRKKFEDARRSPTPIKNTDVIRLNIGGETMTTTRETLIRVPKSILSYMFNGRWEHKLKRDPNGNIFLDYEPILFRHLLDQLQSSDTIYLTPPFDPSLLMPFKKMLRKLHLNQFISSEKKIISLNVGGQIITNRAKTFPPSFDKIISSSNRTKFNDVFIDYNPTLFQYLISQLREEPTTNLCCLKLLSPSERTFYKKMLANFGICKELVSIPRIKNSTKWKQNGITIAGGNENGTRLNQLSYPQGIYVDNDDQSIYIAEWENHRIVEWKCGAINGQVIAGGHGQGNQSNQLNLPVDVLLDKKHDSLIICDHGNRRVIRWSRRNITHGQTIISNIGCYGLSMNDNEELYVSDGEKNEVRRWKLGDSNGTIVAGGNGKGNHLNQLNTPTYIFVDSEQAVYVADWNNHRVMKWMKGAKEGVVVAGKEGFGNKLTQLKYPNGVIADRIGNVYVADSENHRIMRWSPGSKEGSIVVGGNGKGKLFNQFSYPQGLSMDRQGNLYVVDNRNHRVQKFGIDLHKNIHEI